MDTTDSVGFVGLGNAGAPMAANLVAAGHGLVVFDLDRERARDFARLHGCRAVDELAELAGVGVLVTMVTDGNAVREILLGDERLAEALGEGAVVVDTSSSDPRGTRELADELAGFGVSLVDAAVSVPEVGVHRDGRITFMAGADDGAAFERVLPLLEAMGAHVFRMGPTGSGHAMKTLNNYVSAAGLHGALDALIVGYRNGLDPATMLDVLNVSTGRNFSSEQTLRLHALPRDFDTGYTLALLVKDLTIALGFAESLDLDTRLYELVRRDFAAALEDLGSGDITSSLLHWEHRGEVQLPASRPQERAAGA